MYLKTFIDRVFARACSKRPPPYFLYFCQQISAAPISITPTYEDNVKISTELSSEYDDVVFVTHARATKHSVSRRVILQEKPI